MAKPDLAKRQAFACAYAELGNATQAALRAGVPQSSAHSMGYRWLRDDRVVGMVKEAMDLLISLHESHELRGNTECRRVC
jgi:phage terminase small subunit